MTQVITLFYYMKLTGYLKGSGKLGNIVVSNVAGVSIARDYNPNVSNPSTTAQMNQRAKMKLASQIAAALAPVIAIPKEGLISSRNRFIKKNFAYFSADAGVAQVSYENLQLTDGNTGLPAIHASRVRGESLTLQLQQSADAAVSRVVYVIYRKTDEQTLQFIGSAIVEEAGDDGLFTAELSDVEGDVIIWAYGMKDRSSAASVKYGSYSIASGEDIASLVTARTLSAAEYAMTQTRGCTIFAADSESIRVPDGYAAVYITATEGGSVSGAQFANGRRVVEIGTSVTITATPDTGMMFKGWRKNGTTSYVSTDVEYTFAVQGTTDLVGVFEEVGELGGI